MNLVKINGVSSFGKSMAQRDLDCCPKPKHHRHHNPTYRGVVVVENPKTEAALRMACRIIAADMYEKGRK